MRKTKQARSKIRKRPVAAKAASLPSERRILVLAPMRNDARLTAEFLGKAGLSPHICGDVTKLCNEVAGGCGAILLAEETLGHDSIRALVRTLTRQPPWSDIPVTIITSGGEASVMRLRRLAIFGPGVTLMERPFRPSTLISTLEVALRSRQRQYEVRNLMEALSDARVRMEATLGAADVGTWVWDIRKDRVVADRNLARLFSLPAGDFTEGPVEIFINAVHHEDQPRVRAAIAAALKSDNGELEIDYRISRSSGPIRWVTARGQVERDDRGRPIRFPGVVIDITERKQQQDALAILACRIEDQARVFNTTLSHINDFAYIFDRQGRFLYANQPLLNLWGLTLEQAVGKNFFELHYPKALATRLHSQIRQVINTKKPVRDETSYTSTTGLGGYYEYIFSPVLGPDGNVEMVAGSTRDITEKKQAERRLERAHEEAVAASRAKDDFLAALSHELRTPLNPVLLLASEAADNAQLPAEVRAQFTTIRNNVELEARLIDDLLDITRITHGKLSFKPRAVEIHALLNETIATMQSELNHKQLALTLELAAERSTVKGDPVRLQQVFWNVLRNAIKFTPPAGKIAVGTRVQAETSELIITVADTGIGIIESERVRIFEPFAQGEHTRTSGAHRFGGLGLGLAISRMLVESHSGNIEASSAGRNQGSTFTIAFPLTDERVQVKPALQGEGPPPTSGIERTRPLQILLVEDHEPTRIALAHLLIHRRHEVRTAASLAEARELSKQQVFELLISDIGLPDGNGFELMHELRAGNSDLQGIALTGYGMEEDISRSRQAGFARHLTKPIRVQSLEAALAATIRC